MKTLRLHPFSLAAGCVLTLVASLAAGAAAIPAAPEWEYRIVDDVQSTELEELAEEGWEFAGYLGQGMKGTNHDETLWKRPAK